jgi:hypothetical protein
MIEIKLSKGYVAIVDDEDADLAQYNWSAKTSKRDNTVYAQRTVYWRTEDGKRHQKSIAMHRLILSRKIGKDLLRNEFVDHIKGNGLDNRRDQLRLATNAQNKQNMKKPKTNSSGFKGVVFMPPNPNKPWGAYIRANGKNKFLGSFTTPEEAHEAYMKAAREHFGEFARAA